MLKISTDKELLNINVIHAFLTETYWAKGRTVKEVQRSIEYSLCFGVYLKNNQIGFARVCTDYTVFAHLMDVFILPEHRGKGYSKQLIKTVLEEPQLKSCHLWMLKTSDAHGLYKQFGFSGLKSTKLVMERLLEK